MSRSDRLRWWSDPRQWLRAILMLDDTPHRIALGAAIGVFIGLTPTVGIQMLIVLALSVLLAPVLRFNKMAALIAVYISNPLTMVPLYWFNYLVGTLYFPTEITKEEFAAIFQYQGLREWWGAITNLFVDVGIPLIFGSLIVAAAGALITYPLLLRVLKRLHSDARDQLSPSAERAAAESANPRHQHADPTSAPWPS